MLGFIKKIFGTKNDREIKRIEKSLIQRVYAYADQLEGMSDDELRGQTRAWQEELGAIEDDDQLALRLDEIMPQAFAVVKEGARRLCGKNIDVRGQEVLWEMVHFDVQLIGGYALHKRNIAEMATGEGKTLVATLPVYLNALAGRGVHVVTVNDYLAARDSEWMGALYTFLGLTVGCIQHDQPPSARRDMYNRDITYGTNAEMGFDYLRDNGMAQSAEEQVQRGHYFAIVDEVDSILIDEARTPLIISGPAQVKQDQRLYSELKPRIQDLVRQQKRLCDKYIREANELIKNWAILKMQRSSTRSVCCSTGYSKASPSILDYWRPRWIQPIAVDRNWRKWSCTRTKPRSSCMLKKKNCFLRSTRKAMMRISRRKGVASSALTIQKPL